VTASGAQIGVGCVIHWDEYQFDDGATADKFFVVLGAKAGSNYLVVIATSQPHRRKFQAGCHHESGYFHIPGGSKDWFPKDTWLLLAEPREITISELLKLSLKEKRVKAVGQLRIELANAIRNCLKLCDDISKQQIALL
jgi:hypothetical protein